MARSVKVAVVGAGPAGLVAARELLREGHAVTVFEKSGWVGGTWAYDPRTESDPVGLDPTRPVVHGSTYASLRTNLPRELMGFSGFGFSGRVFARDGRSFPGHEEVLAFLEAFAAESGVVASVLRLEAEVVWVGPTGQGEGWTVTWRRRGDEMDEEFEAVVVGNGHCTEPRLPWIPGIQKWPGRQMHSHNYRTPEPFQDQIVVVIGMAASGIDISREISSVAKEVHIASRYMDDRLGKLDLYDNVWLHSEVNCVHDDGQVFFNQGSSVFADVILYCTGYKYRFPFLDLDDITVDDNRVGPLYQHVFPPKYAPYLSFIGLTSKTIPFLSMELQSRWVARVLSGKVALPSEDDMMASVNEYYRRMEESGMPKRYTHSWPGQWVEHIDWLATEADMPPLEKWMCEMYEKTLKCIWSLDVSYRDNWDAEISGIARSSSV